MIRDPDPDPDRALDTCSLHFAFGTGTKSPFYLPLAATWNLESLLFPGIGIAVLGAMGTNLISSASARPGSVLLASSCRLLAYWLLGYSEPDQNQNQN